MQTPSPRSTDIRPLLPIYLVIFVAFIGYAMMVNFFVPLLMHNHGFLSPTASKAQRTTAVGILLAINGAKDLWFLPQNWIAEPLIVDLGPFLLIHLAHGHGFPFTVFFYRAFKYTRIKTRPDDWIVIRALNFRRIHEIVRADAEGMRPSAHKVEHDWKG